MVPPVRRVPTSERIVFGGYRRRAGTVDFTDASKAYFFPVGVPGLFRQYNAPASPCSPPGPQGRPEPRGGVPPTEPLPCNRPAPDDRAPGATVLRDRCYR